MYVSLSTQQNDKSGDAIKCARLVIAQHLAESYKCFPLQGEFGLLHFVLLVKNWRIRSSIKKFRDGNYRAAVVVLPGLPDRAAKLQM
jgi:hypothetical protein